MAGRFYLKVYRAEGSIVVAICDEEVLGKKFVDASRGVVLEVPESFYRGAIVGEREALEHIAVADIAVLTGRRIVELAIKEGLGAREAILEVGGQLHLQIIKETKW